MSDETKDRILSPEEQLAHARKLLSIATAETCYRSLCNLTIRVDFFLDGSYEVYDDETGDKICKVEGGVTPRDVVPVALAMAEIYNHRREA